MLDKIPHLPNFNSSDVRLCRDYIAQHGEVAGYTLNEFEGGFDEQSEVPVNELEEMVQAVFDEIQ